MDRARNVLPDWLNSMRPSVRRHRQIMHHIEEVDLGARDRVSRLERRLDKLEPLVRPVDPRLDAIETTLYGHPPLSIIREEMSRLRQRPAVSGLAFELQDDTGRTFLGFSHAGEGEGSGYAGFEDTFRGDDAFVRARLLPYFEMIGDRQPVLDIGCGRGEMLSLLRERQIPCQGVDPDADMVARANAAGHSVVHDDAVSYLERAEPDSIGVIFMSHVVEHLDADEFEIVLREAIRVLKPDGRLLAETPNPHSLEVVKTFWVDLTHKHPIFPEVFLDHARRAGFASGRVVFPWGSGNLDEDTATQGAYSLMASKHP